MRRCHDVPVFRDEPVGTTPPPHVESVSSSPGHTFRKTRRDHIRLVPGRRVEGAAHYGETVKHRSRVRRAPDQPNLRQVHFISDELYVELRARGFSVSPGDLGENVTTHGIDLLVLPEHTRLCPDGRDRSTRRRRPVRPADRAASPAGTRVMENDE